MKKKFRLSPGEKLSMFIATAALISAIFTTYIQFFYKTTALQIGTTLISEVSDSLSRKIDINVLLLNTGTNPVAFTAYHTFLSADESLTYGVCYNNDINRTNNALYTYGCGSIINEVLEPNNVNFVNLHFAIENQKLFEFQVANKENDNHENFNLGIFLSFVDSNGKKVKKEIIIGSIQFDESGSNWRSFNINPNELEIY